MIFRKPAAMVTEDELHVLKPLLTHKCRQQSYCHLLQVKFLQQRFPSRYDDYLSNVGNQNEDALKLISCVWKSSMSIHSNATKSKVFAVLGFNEKRKQ